MKFEVINSIGRCMQYTEYPQCIPYDLLEGMAAHGYKFRVDGKIVAKHKVKQAVNESLGLTVPKETPMEIVGVDLARESDKTGHRELVHSTSIPTKGKPKIAIMCIEDNLTFQSQSEAAEHYGISPMSVSNSIKSGKPTKGHTFKKI